MDNLEYLILALIILLLIIIYCVYILYSDKKKIKYYNSIIYYDVSWDKYSDMVILQKRIIRKKKRKLFFLESLVKIKEVFK